MSSLAPLSFPGGRIVAGWWRQLASLQPASLWIAYLLVHRVEAPVRVARRQRPDQFLRLVLKAIADLTQPTVELLDNRLHLGMPFLRLLLRSLQRDDLVACVEERWTLTSRGLQAHEKGEYQESALERRHFCFVESTIADHPCHFINLRAHQAAPYQAGTFDVACLAQSMAHTPEWKRDHGFPLDVEQLVTPENGTPEWRTVVVDRMELLPVVLVRHSDKLAGFSFVPESWSLLVDDPLFRIGNWQELFPELTRETPLEQWESSWNAWCEPRGLLDEQAPPRLEQSNEQLRVVAAKPLAARLRGHGPLLKGDIWLLAGTGRFRCAARVQIADA